MFRLALYRRFASSGEDIARILQTVLSNPDALDPAKQAEVEKFFEEEAKEKSKKPLPKASIYNFQSVVDRVITNFWNEFNQIPAGKADIGLVNGIHVYSFGEYVPLGITADIKVISDTELVIKALDYANTASIEIALKRAGLQANIIRDFDTLKVRLTGVVTEDLRSRLTGLQSSTQDELAKIKEKSVKSLKDRDSSQVEVVEKIYEKVVNLVGKAVESKLQAS
mmetsp:Transcript_1738/g.3698  ORF Transcript_1738/g.3698 Transcript_1738/m.3698 type:complete len:224 (-) Transcript_1738:29-700(-)